MRHRSLFARWEISLIFGLLLTPIAALGGTLLALMTMGGLSCFTSRICWEILLPGLSFGTILAAPCAALLIPIFYIFRGSRMRLGPFAIISAVLGAATVEGWEFVSFIADPNQLRPYAFDPLLPCGILGGFFFGVVYLPVMRFIDTGSPRIIPDNLGAAS